MRNKTMLVSLMLVTIWLATLASTAQARDFRQSSSPDSPVVARVYFADRDDLNRLANQLDVWEVQHAEGYLVALLTPAEYDMLTQAGYQLEVDEARTAELYKPHTVLPGQGPDTIPGYPCYRTVEETYASMDTLVAAYPGWATKIDIGNSWDKNTGGGPAGYDIYAIKLTNPAIGGTKPTFFLMAEIHARELVTSETAMRFAEYLMANYGIDPDITWLLDYYQVYFVPTSNPDGRKFAETGDWWRKNTDSDDGCSDPTSWGTDLNRNNTFKWGDPDNIGPCWETYQGPTPGSEPETQAITQTVRILFEDQRGPLDTDPAPADATGLFITLHSYSQLVLWPWGWTGTSAPNGTQLRTLGRKLAYFNGYTPEQSYGLYETHGSSDDWSYGELGIASYTVEMGTDFFQDCPTYISTIYPDSRDMLLAAFKSARRPYMEPSGPDALNVTVVPSGATTGELITLSATVDDNRFSTSNGTEPTQNIVAAEYYIDTPPWITDTVPVPYPMVATDGSFNDEKIEDVTATIDTSGLSLGRHMIFVRGQDANGNWGVVSATFLYIVDPLVAPSIEGYVRDASTNQPLAAIVTAGIFQASTDPATGFYSMTVVSGNYVMTAEASEHTLMTVPGVQAQDYQTVQQDFYLTPICSILLDNVEGGNLGWTPSSPWAITTEASHSPTHSWTESPSGNYGPNRNISLTSPTFDLSGYTGVTLNFWQTYITEPSYDFCLVEVYNGSTWASVAIFNGSQTTWERQSLALPSLDGVSNARVRFRFTSDYYTVNDGWHIDDIFLGYSGATCLPPLAPTAEFTSSVTIAVPGEAIQFTDLTVGTPPFTYLWDFGDEVGTSSEATPSYTYNDTGTYTVTLAVTNSLGTDSVSHSILVQEEECMPVDQVELSLLNPGPLMPGDVAHFSANFLPESFTRPVSYTVDFDDATPPLEGTTINAPLLFDHTFAALGDYEVVIAAWNCAAVEAISSTLQTSVITYTAGLEVSPLTQSGSGDPGTPVTYTFTVTNTGQQPDSINVTLDEASWPVSLPSPIGSLAAGVSANVLVTVTIPADTLAGALDTASMQFTCSHANVEPVTVAVTTTANSVFGLDLMVEDDAQAGLPGNPVTYTLHLTNMGNTADTFDVELTSLWEARAALTVGPLASGESITLTVVVTVPYMTAAGTSDTATVKVISQGDPTWWQELALITKAQWNGVILPLIYKSP